MVVPFVDWKMTKNRFPELRANFPVAVGRVIAKATNDGYARSQITVPVRRPDVEAATGITGGALKNSGQVKVSGDKLTGEVFYVMFYAGYVHEGTVFMPARPWLKDAFMLIIPSMEAAFAQMEGQLLP